MKTKVINIIGGPGVGKSSVAAAVFAEMKKRSISCELVSEYAKEPVWEGNENLLKNQIHIFSEQFRRQWRLVDKVEYIITDCPLLLNSVYFDFYLNKNDDPFLSSEYITLLNQTFDKAYFEFENYLYYLKRETNYDPQGRIQIELEARDIDKAIEEKLDYYGLSYYNVNLETASAGILSKHGVYLK